MLTINTRFQCAPDARHKCGTTMFAFYIGFSGKRTLSAKTVRLRKSRGNRRHCRCNQQRESPIPTSNTRESCRSQSRRSPDNVSFHVEAWTRRTTQQCFPQDVLCLSWRSDWDHANTVDNRQSNTKLNNFVKKKIQSFLRNRFKCLPWIFCAQRCCWHHYYEILLFLEKIQTTRDDDPEYQQVLVLESSTTSGGSTNHDTGTAAPPYWILSRGR